MSNETLVHQILQQHFREECELIGEENVRTLLYRDRTPVSIEGGEKISVMELVGVVAAVIGFADSAISLAERAFGLKGAPVTSGELIAEVRANLKVPDDVDDETIAGVCETICKQLAGIDRPPQ